MFAPNKYVVSKVMCK
ncbi:hypothetical protein E4V15_13280 [Proteus mirabilis]|nr:hypothetical protein GBN12_17855 [Proteus mirabilis]KAB7717847.1 hypothetical protein GBN13_18220 [Proteus mirabilis]MBC6386690.1 hypothetical protein [Proteus mirabilis]MBN7188984.1 hypothetical protein [Proteus mirabilis]MBN7243126.1 hypothetical protein [Proteus mirabilis]